MQGLWLGCGAATYHTSDGLGLCRVFWGGLPPSQRNGAVCVSVDMLRRCVRRCASVCERGGASIIWRLSLAAGTTVWRGCRCSSTTLDACG
jgi:hypothetical protein